MIFQTLDDKQQCVGVYVDGRLHFEEFPKDLHQTWKYSAFTKNDDIEYAWIQCGGLSMEKACPDRLQEELETASRKFRAYLRSFELGKINLREHCVFELIPEDFLMQFCEIKNKITQHVFENYEKPQNYEHLKEASRILYKIKHQDLHINNKDCKNLFLKSASRKDAQKILNGPNYIDYDLYGTATGRLTTKPGSLPILTMKKQLRKLIKPTNDWFLSLDYNGAEIRTLLSLSGKDQPEDDIHAWNLVNILKRSDMPREEAKTIFFSWLYNPESKIINTEYYDRKKVLDKWYDGEYISTPFHRRIPVDERRAFNYLIQSTTADLVIERASAIDRFLEGKRSFISHIVHDEIVIDLDNSEREIVSEIKDIFANNKLGKFMVNIHAGQDYFDLNELRI
jgi:hypothetical protein|tara:strand:- start:15807 stop:16994 length:1188 start_codon:yes stop_codon:yes gene_type:complete